MGMHNGRHRIGEPHTLENFRAHNWMYLHLVELFVSQLAGLGNDVFRHGQLSNIVQQRCRLYRLHLQLIQP